MFLNKFYKYKLTQKSCLVRFGQKLIEKIDGLDARPKVLQKIYILLLF